MNRSKLLSAAAAVLAALLPAGAAFADPLLLADRQMPGTNVNAASDRSNFAAYSYDYGGGDLWYVGDAFFIPPTTTASGWRIDSVVMWSVDEDSNFGQEFQDISLYGGVLGTSALTTYNGLSRLTTGTVQLDGTNSNANINSQRVWYTGDVSNPVSATYQPGDQDYLSSVDGTTPFPLFQHTFSNLNWIVEPGTWYYMATFANGRTVDPATGYGQWTPHVSVAGLSGGYQLGADQQYDIFYSGDLYTVYPAGDSALDTRGVDMNAQIFGTATPEPGTYVLIAAGLISIALLRRRR